MFSSNSSQVSSAANYIEDVFSTYLYTGNGSTQTITNGIDLAGKGGATWIKVRDLAGEEPTLFNTATQYGIGTNTTSYNTRDKSLFWNVTSSGFTIPSGSGGNSVINQSGKNYASWTFRKQPKFFDVVTWTGSNDSGTSIGKGIVPHNLGSAPGCVIIKNVTQGSTNWIVYHRSLSGDYRMLLNTTDAQTNSGSASYFSKYDNTLGWVQTDPDANNIYVGYNYQTNGNGDTIVAYLFAHNAGGFGLTGTDNVISCGSYTGNGSASGPTITLGYEPQYLMIKNASGTGNWQIIDSMRGMPVGSADAELQANLSNAESSADYVSPNATGFQIVSTSTEVNTSASTYIYIAIRRGPMKVPTDGTTVYQGYTYTGNGANSKTFSGLNFPADLAMWLPRNKNPITLNAFNDRLRGFDTRLETNSTAAETTSSVQIQAVNNTNFQLGAASGTSGYNYSGLTVVIEFLRRAPSFFDVVCYTGTGSATTFSHNLGVAPELMIFKCRSNASTGWPVYSPAGQQAKYLQLQTTAAAATSGAYWNSTAPTASVFSVGTDTEINGSGRTYVAYLFASCPGVSKVGTYTGNGSTQTINCGFTGGARFVLIKRTDSTGNWMVVDTARGLVSAGDPTLYLNSTAAEVTGVDWIDPNSSGFIVNQESTMNANVSSATYIYLAIA